MKPIDRAEYLVLCSARWDGRYLADAKRNFADFEEIRDQLEPALRAYARDPQLEDVTGKHHNPDGTLTAMLWQLQTALEPDRSRLHPLLDFEENFQICFLRRGLIAYCTLCLRDIKTIEVEADGETMPLPL